MQPRRTPAPHGCDNTAQPRCQKDAAHDTASAAAAGSCTELLNDVSVSMWPVPCYGGVTGHEQFILCTGSDSTQEGSTAARLWNCTAPSQDTAGVDITPTCCHVCRKLRFNDIAAIKDYQGVCVDAASAYSSLIGCWQAIFCTSCDCT
jgi:hypothetical protein